MNDRIKLAEAMGWTDFIGEAGLPPGAKDQRPVVCGHGLPPDPLTDANDDYAVLEWMRTSDKAEQEVIGGMSDKMLDLLNWNCWEYEVGDFARAALKVIE